MDPLRIANASGFYGDRFSALREMLLGGPVDVLTGDYLSELTMLILWKARQKDPRAGFAATFLAQLEDVLAPALARGVRIVSNAGGLDPAGLAEAVRALAARKAVSARVACVLGDDLLPRLAELQAAGMGPVHAETGAPLSALGHPPLTASAYLGGFGIAHALREGAEVVVTGRVTDASLVVGPAAWRFGWTAADLDALAGAVVAGHIVECGTQATGGNYAFLDEVPGANLPGFPLVEVFPDGSCIVTKHPGTGGAVTVGTVTAQLLYEIDGRRYLNPDAVARFDTVRLEPAGPDRVRVWGARGEPAPRTVKVSVTASGGYRNTMRFVLTGLDVPAKAARLRAQIAAALQGGVDELHTTLLRMDRDDPATSEEGSAILAVTVRDRDARRAGKGFTAAVVELALASVPGLYALSPPGPETAYGVFWPALVPADAVRQRIALDDGRVLDLAAGGDPQASGAPVEAPPAPRPWPAVLATTRRPLGTVLGARSGDKGGNAQVGVWATSDVAWRWLHAWMTVDRFHELLPETAGLDVRREGLPNLRALVFVVPGLLGEGASASPRLDAQAKSLGELLRARVADIPEGL